MIYLDFAKAFDTVDHSVLLKKLRLYGVKGELFCWFKDYLSERTQRVVLKGAASHWSPVTSGVPQGSILGPLLFTLLINDLPDEATDGVKTALYADDTKLYRNVSSTEHCHLIQMTLSNLHDWSQRNNIRANTSKCKVITVTRKKTPIVFYYTLDGSNLTRVSEERDLGVIITSTLSWDSHIHTITAKANKLLGLLKRTCPLLTDVSVRRSLYLSLVKSQLCYATQVWSPAHVTLNAKVEQVQRRASRWILRTRRGEMSYKERLTMLDLIPLSLDRELKDLVFYYKCLYCSTDLDVLNYVSFISHGRTRQSDSFNLRTPLCKTSTFQASYFNRIVKLWNYVCKLAPPTSFCSPNAFQLFVRKLMSTHLSRVYDLNYPCTWTLVLSCSCHS